MGIKDNQIKAILKLHDEDYILDNIAYVEEEIKNGKKIKNIPAYLLKAFKVDFRPIETDFEKTQKDIQIKSTNKNLKLNILNGKFKEERSAKLAKAKELILEEEYEELKTAFEDSIQKNEIVSKAYTDKGFNHPMIQSMWNVFLIKRKLPLEYHDFENYKDAKLGVATNSIE